MKSNQPIAQKKKAPKLGDAVTKISCATIKDSIRAHLVCTSQSKNKIIEDLLKERL